MNAPRSPSSRQRVLCWLIPALVAAIVFSNTLAGGFVYDDPIILRWLGTRRWDLEGMLFQKRALTYVVHAADRSLWGDWAGGYHLTNVLLHALATALAAHVALRLTRSALAATICGLAFAVHPVHVEAVANIANRKDLLAMVFAMAVLGSWLDERRGALRTSAAVVAFVFGLYSKEVAIAALPVLLVCVDLLRLSGGVRAEDPQRRVLARSLIRVAPFVALLGLGLFVFIDDPRSLFAPASIAAKSDGAYSSYHDSLATASGNMVDFFRLLLFPWRLTLDYPVGAQSSFLDGRALLGLGLTLTWIALAVAAAVRGKRLVAFALLWSLVMYVPCANILPLHHILVAERYLYTPSFGVCLLLGMTSARMLEASRSGSPEWTRQAVTIGLTGILTAGAFRSFTRNADWRDWPALIAAGDRDGVDTWRMHKSGGYWAIQVEDFPEAIRRYSLALERRPGDPELHFWLGISLQRLGRLDEAIEKYHATLALEPGNAKAHYNLGLARIGKGELPAAIESLRSATELDPDYGMGYYNLGIALSLVGDGAAARDALEECARLMPDFLDVHLNLGAVYRSLGDPEGAVASFREAARCNGNDPRVLEQFGETLILTGQHEEGISVLRHLYSLRKDDPRAVEQLGDAYLRIGDTVSARACYDAALKLAPNPAIEAKRRRLDAGATKEGPP